MARLGPRWTSSSSNASHSEIVTLTRLLKLTKTCRVTFEPILTGISVWNWLKNRRSAICIYILKVTGLIIIFIYKKISPSLRQRGHHVIVKVADIFPPNFQADCEKQTRLRLRIISRDIGGSSFLRSNISVGFFFCFFLLLGARKREEPKERLRTNIRERERNKRE